MSKSTDFPRPKKPRKDFPLTPHRSGKWMKKIRGKIHYFGRWANWHDGVLVPIKGEAQWKPALEDYRKVADDLHAGRTPRVAVDGLTVEGLCDKFMDHQDRKFQAGEIGKYTFDESKAACVLLVKQFGLSRLVDDLAAPDFAALRASMARKWGPTRLANVIGRIKSVFKFGLENGLIEKAIRYGTEFRKPSASVLRKHKANNGEQMLEAEELRDLIDGRMVLGGKHGPALAKPDATMKAMILLGVNCGLGNTDVATLSLSALDLDAGWLNFPRPKTGVARRCPLWPETVQAIRDAIKERPKPETHEAVGRVFLTEIGTPLIRLEAEHRSDRVTKRFIELLKKTKMHRPRLSFYTLRHTFRTIADNCRDTPAIDLIMGHADHSMAGRYRERIDDARLVAVTDTVRKWLWPEAKTEKTESK